MRLQSVGTGYPGAGPGLQMPLLAMLERALPACRCHGMPAEHEKELLQHVRHGFGWFGGMGDPPDDETVCAVIRATLALGPDLSYPEDEAEANRLLDLVRRSDAHGFGPRTAISDLPDDVILAVIRGTAAFLEEHSRAASEPRR